MKNIFQAVWDRFFFPRRQQRNKKHISYLLFILTICNDYYACLPKCDYIYGKWAKKKSYYYCVIWYNSLLTTHHYFVRKYLNFRWKKSDYKHETMKVITSAQLRWVKLNWISFQYFSVATCHIWELTFHLLNTGHRYEFHL